MLEVDAPLSINPDDASLLEIARGFTHPDLHSTPYIHITKFSSEINALRAVTR